jgi:hypothetical protein
LKEADQELLDEMIVKDVPDSESSTDPVKLFEDSQPVAGISPISAIQEDQEDTSVEVECKEQSSLSQLALATSTPLKSLPTPSHESNESFRDSSSDPSPEMPIENDIKLQNAEVKSVDEDNYEESCLAAPDSKDSLEVQVYSVCDDLSEMAENFSGREESYDDIKQKQESSTSEDEREPTINEKYLTSDQEIVQETVVSERTIVKQVCSKVQEDPIDDSYEIISESGITEEIDVKADTQLGQISSLSPIEEKSVTISEVADDITTQEKRQETSHSSDEDLKNVEDTFEIVESESVTEEEIPIIVEEKLASAEVPTIVETPAGEKYAFEPGLLIFTIHKAKDLENSDYIGKSDPFVCIRYNDQEFKSEVKNNTLEPEWNFTAEVRITEDDEQPILVEVFDADYDQADPIGSAYVNVEEYMEKKEISNQWISLIECKSGQLLISTVFVPKAHDSTVTEPEEPAKELQISCSSSSSFSEVEVHNNKGIIQKDSSDYDSTSNLSDQKVDGKSIHAPLQQDTFEEDEERSSSSESKREEPSSESEEEHDTTKKVTQYDSSDYSSDHGPKKPPQYDSSDYSSEHGTKKPPHLAHHDSSDYSSEHGEKLQARHDSSDYDSISNVRPKETRPDSFISDTSSDYSSSNLDAASKRPTSFVLDDDYEVITEEEISSSRHEIITEKKIAQVSSSSEFDGPDTKEADVRDDEANNIIPPPAIQIESLKGDKEHDGVNGISQPTPIDNILPEESIHPLPSSVASSCPLLSSDLHAEQSSINVDVAESSVINSNTLEEIDPLDKDQEINTSTNISNDKPSPVNNLIQTTPEIYPTDVPSQSTSSSSSSSVDNALRDGSSDSEKAQEDGRNNVVHRAEM